MWPREGLLAASVPAAKRAEGIWEAVRAGREHRKVGAVAMGWDSASSPSGDLRPTECPGSMRQEPSPQALGEWERTRVGEQTKVS